MSEKLFGRMYETVGSSSSDLLLKSKGSVKIQWGNKFIELIKDGNINYPRESIKKLIDETIAASQQQESEESEETISIEDLKKELEEKIISEETSRSNSDVEIKSQIIDCIARIDKLGNIPDIETSLKNLITAEKNRAVKEEHQLRKITEALSNLLSTHNRNLKNLQETVELVINSSGLDEDGSYITSTESNYITEATSIHDATVKLDSFLKTESTNLNTKIDQELERALIVENNLQESINTINDTTIPNLKTTLQTEIDADVLIEKNRAEGVESVLTTNLNNEITRAIKAEGDLQTAINTINNTTISDLKTTLQQEIDSDVLVEKNRAEKVESDLSERITPIETTVATLEQNVVPAGGVILFDKTKTLPENWTRLTTEEYDVQIGDLSYVYIVKE